VQTINGLQARSRDTQTVYQFWFFAYPTGNPVPLILRYVPCAKSWQKVDKLYSAITKTLSCRPQLGIAFSAGRRFFLTSITALDWSKHWGTSIQALRQHCDRRILVVQEPTELQSQPPHQAESSSILYSAIAAAKWVVAARRHLPIKLISLRSTWSQRMEKRRIPPNA